MAVGKAVAQARNAIGQSYSTLLNFSRFSEPQTIVFRQGGRECSYGTSTGFLAASRNFLRNFCFVSFFFYTVFKLSLTYNVVGIVGRFNVLRECLFVRELS